jgi:GPH family glycoside/pentoside/hexuronide:cation symporter
MRNFVTYSNDVSSIGLHNRVLYSTGIVSHALKEAAMGVFVLLYYKQVLGLSGTLTGLAIGISIIWDGISDPLVGAWSDRLRSRIGRRHPLMIAAVIPMAAGFVMLYGPPDNVLSDQGQLFAWLLISILLVRTALTFFMVPYLALGAEITNDYHERTQLAAVRTNMAWIIGTLVSATALIFLFNEENGLDGRFLIDNYHFFGWVNGLLVILFSVICIIGTWQYIPKLDSGTAHADSNMLRDIFITFRNKNFSYMVVLDMAVGGIGSITATLLMVTYIYFWQLDAIQTSLLFAGPIFLAVLFSAVFSRSLNRLFEKQQILRLTCALTSINLLWLTPLKLFDLLPDNSTVVFALIYFNWAIHMTMTILRVITVHSMLADIVDEQELATGKRNEGVVFAAAFFSSKFMGAFGYLIAGPFLDLIGLQAGAQPDEVSSTVTWGLGLIMGPGLAIIMLLPVWMSFKVNMSHATQLEVRQALSQRQQAAESGDSASVSTPRSH